jgi:hypothetical protein
VSDEKNRSSDPSLFIHEPLPYIVYVRSTLSDDAVPEIRAFRVTAYGIFEAWLGALILAGANGVEDTRHRVESIEPDLPAYMRMMSARLMSPKGILS